jgi:hypothetical protein
MSRAFEEMLAERDLWIGFSCTIGGLPYIFADFDEPSHWLIPSDYTWSKTLVPYRATGDGRFDSAMKAVTEEIDWHSGMTISGNMDLEFLIDEEDPNDVWRNLIIPESRETWLLDGEVVQKPSNTHWTFRSTTSLAGTALQVNDVVHSGPGCAKVQAINGNDVTMQINKYGSFHDWSGPIGFVRGAPRGGDVEVTNWPKVWRRRPVSVWIHFFSRVGGVKTAIGGSWREFGVKNVSGSDREIFSGEAATFPTWNGASPVVGLICQGLEQPLGNPLVRRDRRYRPGPELKGMGACFVETTGPCLVQWEIHERNRYFETAPYFADGIQLEGVIDLTWLSIAAGGFHTADTLMQAVCDALNALTIDDAGQGAVVFRWSPDEGPIDDTEPDGSDLGRPKMRLEVARYYAGSWSSISFPVRIFIKSAIEPERQVLRAAGFEEDIVFEGRELTFTEPWSYVTASNEIPHYHLAPGNKWIYYHGPVVNNPECDDPPTVQGTVGLDGHVDAVYMRFGEHEIMEVRFRFPGGDYFQDPDGRHLAYIEQRAVLGYAKVVTIPFDEVEDEKHALTIGLFFNNHDLFDVTCALLVSNGDPNTLGLWDDPARRWNVLPQGFGAMIPASRIAEATFEMARFRSYRPIATSLWIEGSLTAREFLSEVALFTGVNFLNIVENSVRKLGVVPMEPPIGAESVISIDDSWVDDVRRPMEPDYDEMTIRNRISFEFDFDPLTQKFYGRDNSHMDGQSVANYGMSEPLEIRVRWLSSFGEVAAQLDGVAAALFRRFADPLVGYQLPAARPEAWQLKAGDVVDVTRSREPDFRDGGLGFSAVPMRIEHASFDYGPEETFGDLRLTWFQARLGRPWAPCMRMEAQVGATKFKVYAVATGQAFTPSEDGREDVAFFAVGDRVRCYIPGKDVKDTARIITAIDADLLHVTLNGVLNLTPTDGVVIEYNAFDTSGMQDAQFEHVFPCGVNGYNTDDGGTKHEGSRWS